MLFEIQFREAGATIGTVKAAGYVPPTGATISLDSKTMGQRYRYRIVGVPPDIWYVESGLPMENRYTEAIVILQVEQLPNVDTPRDVT